MVNKKRQAGEKNTSYLVCLNGFDSEASLVGRNSKWSSRNASGDDKPPS
jgi:hypothetical protein